MGSAWAACRPFTLFEGRGSADRFEKLHGVRVIHPSALARVPGATLWLIGAGDVVESTSLQDEQVGGLGISRFEF